MALECAGKTPVYPGQSCDQQGIGRGEESSGFSGDSIGRHVAIGEDAVRDEMSDDAQVAALIRLEAVSALQGHLR